MFIKAEHIVEAHQKISPYLIRTPLIYSEALSRLFKAEIYLKCENFQKNASFKVRGALNKFLSLSKKDLEKGVVASSAGNHAQGVAFCAQLLGVKAQIVMP